MKAFPTLAVLALATACTGGGEPGEADIQTALTQAGNRGGPKAVKLACTRGTDKPGFVCDYRAPACNRFTGACGSPKPGSGRFVKAGGGWQLVEDLTTRVADAPGTTPLPAPSASGPGITFPPTPIASAAPAPFPSFSRPVERPAPPPDDIEDAPDYERPPLTPRDLTLISRWIGLNARCELDDGDSEEARDACFERDDLTQRMRRRGLCYGGGGRDTVAKWHRCD